jgi:hypothetical protein
MGVFKDLKQVGYKQKSEFAIEVLDNMDSNNIEKFIEIRLALRWFHTLGFHYSAIPYVGDGVMKYIALVIDGESRTTKDNFIDHIECELFCLKEMIKRKRMTDYDIEMRRLLGE